MKLRHGTHLRTCGNTLGFPRLVLLLLASVVFMCCHVALSNVQQQLGFECDKLNRVVHKMKHDLVHQQRKTWKYLDEKLSPVFESHCNKHTVILISGSSGQVTVKCIASRKQKIITYKASTKTERKVYLNGEYYTESGEVDDSFSHVKNIRISQKANEHSLSQTTESFLRRLLVSLGEFGNTRVILIVKIPPDIFKSNPTQHLPFAHYSTPSPTGSAATLNIRSAGHNLSCSKHLRQMVKLISEPHPEENHESQANSNGELTVTTTSPTERDQHVETRPRIGRRLLSVEPDERPESMVYHKAQDTEKIDSKKHLSEKTESYQIPQYISYGHRSSIGKEMLRDIVLKHQINGEAKESFFLEQRKDERLSKTGSNSIKKHEYINDNELSIYATENNLFTTETSLKHTEEKGNALVRRVCSENCLEKKAAMNEMKGIIINSEEKYEPHRAESDCYSIETSGINKQTNRCRSESTERISYKKLEHLASRKSRHTNEYSVEKDHDSTKIKRVDIREELKKTAQNYRIKAVEDATGVDKVQRTTSQKNTLRSHEEPKESASRVQDSATRTKVRSSGISRKKMCAEESTHERVSPCDEERRMSEAALDDLSSRKGAREQVPGRTESVDALAINYKGTYNSIKKRQKSSQISLLGRTQPKSSLGIAKNDLEAADRTLKERFIIRDKVSHGRPLGRREADEASDFIDAIKQYNRFRLRGVTQKLSAADMFKEIQDSMNRRVPNLPMNFQDQTEEFELGHAEKQEKPDVAIDSDVQVQETFASIFKTVSNDISNITSVPAEEELSKESSVVNRGLATAVSMVVQFFTSAETSSAKNKECATTIPDNFRSITNIVPASLIGRGWKRLNMKRTNFANDTVQRKLIASELQSTHEHVSRSRHPFFPSRKRRFSSYRVMIVY